VSGARYRTALAAGCVLLACSACGFKGPLYLPERNAKVVTHPAPAAQSAPMPAQAPAPPTSSKDKRKANQQQDGAPPTTPPTP
jgi:predicted small lipoprotein YifL